MSAATIFPLIVKPRYGQGSVGVQRIDGYPHLTCRPEWFDAERFIIQDLVDGAEFTIDIGLSASEILYVVPRSRSKVRESESYVSTVVLDRELIEFARGLLSGKTFNGLLNIQVMRNSEGIHLIEINPRLASGVDLAAAAGAPVHEHLVDWCLTGEMAARYRRPLTDRLVMSRFPDAIFFSEVSH